MVVASTGNWNLARVRSSADERCKSRVPGAQQGCGLEARMRCDSHDCVLLSLLYLQICTLERSIESRRVRLKHFGQTARPAQQFLENAGPFQDSAFGTDKELAFLGKIIGTGSPIAMPIFAQGCRLQSCRATYPYKP